MVYSARKSLAYIMEIELTMRWNLPTANLVKEGDYTLIFLNKRKNWLIKVERGKQFHTHRGIVDIDSIIGLEYGSPVSTSLNETMWVLKPTIQDFVMKSRRRTQVVYPKDLGVIAAWTGLSPGQIVVESGTGSGALTVFALKGSGNLAAISPTMNQVEKLTIELLNQGFVEVETLEVIVRDIEAREGKTRPAMRMIGHTAYLTFARKALKT
jgi:tRNA A58 N-methylase Trm61